MDDLITDCITSWVKLAGLQHGLLYGTREVVNVGMSFITITGVRMTPDSGHGLSICRCKTKQEADELRSRIKVRLAECKLELNEDKTKVVYCKDDDRRQSHSIEKFDFLGYTFRPRRSKNQWGKYFVNFSPAISNTAKVKITRTIRRWQLRSRADKTIEDLARMFNSIIQGWINYYGKFYKSAMYPLFQHLNKRLVIWVRGKFKRFRNHGKRAEEWLGKIAKQQPNLFAHWKFGIRPAVVTNNY